MTRIRAAWPLAALVAAVALAALAVGVRAADRAARTGAPHAGGALARAGAVLLDSERDRRLAHALALADASGLPGLAPGEAARRRALAERELAPLAQEGPRAYRAQAANELAVLDSRDAAVDPRNARRYLDEAVGALQGAVELVPGDDESSFNLELLLTRGEALGRSGSQPQRGRGKPGRSTAGRGSGY